MPFENRDFTNYIENQLIICWIRASYRHSVVRDEGYTPQIPDIDNIKPLERVLPRYSFSLLFRNVAGISRLALASKLKIDFNGCEGGMCIGFGKDIAFG